MAKAEPPRNIIIVVLDTLRKDYASTIENIARRYGFQTLEAIATSPWTIPSHASIFTGLYPLYHEAHETRTRKSPNIKLKKRNILLKLVKEHNYKTHLISANPYVSSDFGFKNFDNEIITFYPYKKIHFLNNNDVILWRKAKQRYGSKIKALLKLSPHNALLSFKLLADISINSIISNIYSNIYLYYKKWPLHKGGEDILKSFNKILNRGGKNFIFINFMEVHEPYTKRENVAREWVLTNLANIQDREIINKWRMYYELEVDLLSKYIEKLLQIMLDKGILQHSLVIITSDHGQLLGEKGRIGHTLYLDDELLRVPFMLHYPKDAMVKYPCHNKIISLKDIIYIINDALNLHREGKKVLTRFFAETYGIESDIKAITEILMSLGINEDKIQEILNIHEKYKIAFYDTNNNFKVIFNVSDWKVEEIISPKKQNIIIDEKYIKKKIIKFIKPKTEMRKL